MRAYRLASTMLGSALVGALYTFPVAALTCGAASPPAARDLVDPRNGRIYSPTAGHEWTEISVNRTSLSYRVFNFVVPNTIFTSGAVVVKIRHMLKDKGQGTEGLALSRDEYVSPCNQNLVGEYRREDVSVEKYRSYHYFLDRDEDPDPKSSLNSFHVDIHPSQADKTKCIRSSDHNIRPQFLFEKRTSAGFGNKFARAAGDLTSRLAPTSALANTAGYSGYGALKTIIIPYKKGRQEFTCVEVPVSFPRSVMFTDIMIVDADEAADPRDIPQGQWRIEQP
jgi:hypothetical protein